MFSSKVFLKKNNEVARCHVTVYLNSTFFYQSCLNFRLHSYKKQRKSNLFLRNQKTPTATEMMIKTPATAPPTAPAETPDVGLSVKPED